MLDIGRHQRWCYTVFRVDTLKAHDNLIPHIKQLLPLTLPKFAAPAASTWLATLEGSHDAFMQRGKLPVRRQPMYHPETDTTSVHACDNHGTYMLFVHSSIALVEKFVQCNIVSPF